VPSKDTYRKNPEHYAMKAREWRKNNPERAREFDRQRHTRRRLKQFGLTQADVDAMKAKQGNRCAVCDKPETLQRPQDGKVRELAFDHCHATGEFRGLLCGSCNQGLGYFFDRPEILRAAADYLEAS
jgi:hypothetical protein